MVARRGARGMRKRRGEVILMVMVMAVILGMWMLGKRKRRDKKG